MDPESILSAFPDGTRKVEPQAFFGLPVASKPAVKRFASLWTTSVSGPWVSARYRKQHDVIVHAKVEFDHKKTSWFARGERLPSACVPAAPPPSRQRPCGFSVLSGGHAGCACTAVPPGARNSDANFKFTHLMRHAKKFRGYSSAGRRCSFAMRRPGVQSPYSSLRFEGRKAEAVTPESNEGGLWMGPWPPSLKDYGWAGQTS